MSVLLLVLAGSVQMGAGTGTMMHSCCTTCTCTYYIAVGWEDEPVGLSKGGRAAEILKPCGPRSWVCACCESKVMYIEAIHVGSNSMVRSDDDLLLGLLLISGRL